MQIKVVIRLKGNKKGRKKNKCGFFLLATWDELGKRYFDIFWNNVSIRLNSSRS